MGGPWSKVIAARGEEKPGGKICSSCLQWKPLDEYWKATNCRLGARAACKECNRAAAKKWIKANPHVVRRQALRHHGMTQAQHDELLFEQHACCAICGSPPSGKALAIDHDHVTGQNRSLLCDACNKGLGHFKDDPALLKRALRYLRRWGKTPAVPMKHARCKRGHEFTPENTKVYPDGRRHCMRCYRAYHRNRYRRARGLPPSEA